MIHVIYSSGCFPKCVKCIIACIWRSFPFLDVWSMINWITVWRHDGIGHIWWREAYMWWMVSLAWTYVECTWGVGYVCGHKTVM